MRTHVARCRPVCNSWTGSIVFLLAFALAPDGQAQPSLQAGIANTQTALQRVHDQLAQNQADLSKLFAKSGLEVFKQAANGSAVDVLKTGYTTGQFVAAVADGDYAKAIMEAAKLIADFWGKADPRVKLGKVGVEVAAEVYEAQSLLRQQAQLTQARLRLEQELLRLRMTRGPDQEIAARVQSIARALDEDAVLHKAFLQSLDQANLPRREVTQDALTDANSLSASAGAQVASGTIVEPQSDIDALEQIPGVNPAFVNALRRQFDLLQAGDVGRAMMVPELCAFAGARLKARA